jgi:hypothetical protein
MKAYIKYIKYIFEHRKLVRKYGRMLGVNWWLIFIHDLSKFLPDEFFPYAEWFYGYGGNSWSIAAYGKVRSRKKSNFTTAWRKHIKRNPHHWNQYAYVTDEGLVVCREMPTKYILEMVADWKAANSKLSVNGELNGSLAVWFNSKKIPLAPNTNSIVVDLLRRYQL